MRTKATVKALQGDLAIVEAERASACEGCHKKTEGENGCAVCSLVGGERRFTATAENHIGARIGDTVFVESATSRVMLYAAMVFLLPILLAFGGYGIVAIFTDQTGFRLIGALVGFLLCFLGLRIYSAHLQKKRPDVVITEILSDEGTVEENGAGEA